MSPQSTLRRPAFASRPPTTPPDPPKRPKGTGFLARVKQFLGGTLRALLVLVAVSALGLAVAFLGVVGSDIESFKGKLPKLGEPVQEVDENQLLATLQWARQQDRLTIEAADDGYQPLALPPAGVDAQPGHWCADRTIGFRIDTHGAELAGLDPRTEIARWKNAFAQWRKASGGAYSFAYRGPAVFPLTRSGGQDAIAANSMVKHEIAITYATAKHAQDPAWHAYRNADLADKLGIGGVMPVSWVKSAPDFGLITRGMVIIDADDAQFLSEATPPAYVHEAGHALGLAHVDSEQQLMFGGAGLDATMGKGDIRGIKRLAALSC